MPIEIRELVIKTTVHTHPPASEGMSKEQLERLKESIIDRFKEEIIEDLKLQEGR